MLCYLYRYAVSVRNQGTKFYGTKFYGVKFYEVKFNAIAAVTG
jgi:hypothetical protein